MTFEDAEQFLQFAPACRFIETDILSAVAEWNGDHEYEDHCDFGSKFRRLLGKHDNPTRHYHRGGVVRLRTLHLRGAGLDFGGDNDGDVHFDWPEFEAIARQHKSLTGLTFSVFYHVDEEIEPPSVEAICDLAIALKLRRLEFDRFALQHDDLPHLARVLRAGSLEIFSATAGWRFASRGPNLNDDWPCGPAEDRPVPPETLWNGPHNAEFIAALKVSKLKSYTLPGESMTPGFGLAVIHAFAGHPTLEELVLGYSAFPRNAALRADELEVGEALARLLSSDGGVLTSLDLGCGRSRILSGLVPLFTAIAQSNTLRHVDLEGRSNLGSKTEIPADGIDHILAAVRQNTSICTLRIPKEQLEMYPLLREAVQIVVARAPPQACIRPART